MKTVELDNKEEWFIDSAAKHEKIVYSCSLETYQHDIIVIITSPSCEIEVSLNHKISAPNLKYIHLEGEESLAIYKNLITNFKSEPSIEGFSFQSTEIDYIPNFVLNSKRLISLTFFDEIWLSELPSELFDLVNLEYLDLHPTSNFQKNITTVPDDIARLKNLKSFALWSASLDYLSDQLFLLPKIKNIILPFSTFTPTKKILKALRVFKERGGFFGGRI